MSGYVKQYAKGDSITIKTNSNHTYSFAIASGTKVHGQDNAVDVGYKVKLKYKGQLDDGTVVTVPRPVPIPTEIPLPQVDMQN